MKYTEHDGINKDPTTDKKTYIKNPEESVHHKYEKTLHDNYGYDYKLMDAEVSITQDSSKSKTNGNFADIVIYKSKNTGDSQ